MSRSNITRRKLLKSAAAAGAGLVILKNTSSAWSFQANEKVNIALIGVSGRGGWFVDYIPKLGQNVVALCDVNERRAAPAYKQFPEVPKFADFRKMLDDMDKQIEAVIVATPDNTHAIISMTALKHGKHVYTEKPLTLTVHESRALREQAAKSKLATQMGNQGTASEAFRRSIELVQGGALGQIRDVLVWNTAGGRGPLAVPSERPQCPPELHWDLWLGPAAERPYHPYWLQWGGWRDLGTSTMGNWGSHSANLAFKALKLDTLYYTAEGAAANPTIRVMAESSQILRNRFPEWEIVRWDFPARGDMPPVRINWINGKTGPTGRTIIESLIGGQLDWGDAGAKAFKDHGGAVLVGTEGVLRLTEHNASFKLHPAEKFADFQGPSKAIPRVQGHEQEWLEACKGGPMPMSNYGYSGPLIETLMLGNVATQFEGRLEYDPIAGKIMNNSEANALLSREYRKGWEL